MHRIPQWDPQSQRYYFVQTSTGTTTWEAPPRDGPAIGSNPSTPVGGGYPQPQTNPYDTTSYDQTSQPEQSERGFGGIAGNLASGLLGGGKKNSSSGLASTLASG